MHTKGISFAKTVDELNQILRAADDMTTEEAVRYLTHGPYMKELLELAGGDWYTEDPQLIEIRELLAKLESK